ncbi:MAG: metallopeptidase family protein [Dehalococcoidia bacterium]
MPDRILFRGADRAALRACSIPREIRRTVLHEVAHHFGIGDARLDELGVG